MKTKLLLKCCTVLLPYFLFVRFKQFVRKFNFIFTLHGGDLDGSVTEMELKLTSVLYS